MKERFQTRFLRQAKWNEVGLQGIPNLLSKRCTLSHGIAFKACFPLGEFVRANRKKQLDWLPTNTDDITIQSHSLFACSREKNRQVENGLWSWRKYFLHLNWKKLTFGTSQLFQCIRYRVWNLLFMFLWGHGSTINEYILAFYKFPYIQKNY